MTKETPEQEAALLEKYAKRIKVNLRNGSYEDHIENIKTGLREYAGELGITAARMYMGEVEKYRKALEKSLEWIADIKQKDIPLDDKKGMALYHIKWLATEALKTT